MSSETLSQNEIDLLLGGGGGGGAAKPKPTARRGDPEVQVYDFRRPHRVSKERLRALEAMYGRMAKSLEGWLIGRLRGQLELTLQSVEQFSFGEFVLSLPSPCASFVVDIRDSGGQQGVIDFGSEFAYLVVDRLFGGSGTPTVLDRPLSTIERNAVRVVAERISTQLMEIWQDHVQLELSIGAFESVPEILQVVNREDPVLVANLEVAAGGISSLVSICMPFSVLEKFFAGTGKRSVKIANVSDRERTQTRTLTERLLRSTRVPVSVRLPEFMLPMRDLAALQAGGILATGIAADTEVEVLVSGQRRFRAQQGRLGSKLGIRIIESIAESPEGEATPFNDQEK
ncbi:MAG: flagellar motor switch protein FliM [Gemmatimonadetes bacterium]|nr:flagellar motor switch protein FliM [Gemmatimonadota bacterium]